jgi:hypothetical protein
VPDSIFLYALGAVTLAVTVIGAGVVVAGAESESSEMGLALIDDRDVWQAAVLIVKRYGDDAMLEAAERAYQLQDEGDMAGVAVWHRILNAIEQLQAKAPAEGEKVH